MEMHWLLTTSKLCILVLVCYSDSLDVVMHRFDVLVTGTINTSKLERIQLLKHSIISTSTLGTNSIDVVRQWNLALSKYNHASRCSYYSIIRMLKLYILSSIRRQKRVQFSLSHGWNDVTGDSRNTEYSKSMHIRSLLSSNACCCTAILQRVNLVSKLALGWAHSGLNATVDEKSAKNNTPFWR